MAQVANELETVFERVPIWGWAALGGGALIIVLARHNAASKVAAAAAVDPNVADPNAGGSDPGVTTPPGVTPDGGTVVPATYNEKLTDIWGSDLSHFLGGLTNQANYVNVTLPGGASFTESNAVGTFGGGNGTVLTSPEEDAIKAQMAKDYYDYTSHNTDSYYTAYSTNLNNWFDVLKTWYSQGGFWVGGGQGGNVTTTTNDPPMIGDPRGGGMTGDPRGGGAFDALIKAVCASGDTACARRVAPGWNGTPIAGW